MTRFEKTLIIIALIYTAVTALNIRNTQLMNGLLHDLIKANYELKNTPLKIEYKIIK
jgi:hypothetical protein